jgi:adenine phosphoribosyltransferase
MVRQLGGEVVALAFIVELEALNGAAKLEGYEVFSMLKY